MFINTTITIVPHARERITNAMDSTGKPVSTLVTACMHRLIKVHERHVRLEGRTRYRERGVIPGNWGRQHLRILCRDYELFFDMRKVCKFSVSLLVDFAIETFLDDVVQALIGGKGNVNDNYPFQHYVIIGETVDSIACWRIYWGFPKNLQL